jgi:hypothetical protein
MRRAAEQQMPDLVRDDASEQLARIDATSVCKR